MQRPHLSSDQWTGGYRTVLQGFLAGFYIQPAGGHESVILPLRIARQGILYGLLMPKPIARRKTKKAVAKRFKITGSGKVLRSQAGRRHLLVSKSAKRKRLLAKTAVLDRTDEARIKENLPFG
jgi:large subunit ribosomal protein L35